VINNLKRESMSFINWGGESPEQLRLRKRLEEEEALFEQAVRMASTVAQAGGVGVGAKVPYWKTATDTAYLYPKSDLVDALALTNVEYTKEGNRYIFANLVDLDLFYYDVWYRTSISQPLNNTSYSLAVNTELRGSFDQVHLDLANGTRIITWQLMTQLTSQSSLPVGGDSPDGTIGYGAVYSDVNGDGVPGLITDMGAGNIDPLRFQRID
jgi:hypothetical protein